MKEAFLSFIWKHQYFDKYHLKTEQGDKLQILDPGHSNPNSGPDFSEARVRIADTEWIGLVEIHVKSSDWFLHKHHLDPSYDQVILHVVWNANQSVSTTDGRLIATLVLNHRVASSLILNQRRLEMSATRVPCDRFNRHIDPESLQNMMDRTIKQRLERKSTDILKMLGSYHGDWDQVTYLVFGKNFGFYINSEAFLSLVGSVPLSITRKISTNLFQLEAIYYGQAGLLETITGDAYFRELQSEYRFLQKKFSLASTVLRRRMWKYLRLRPSNFPTIRIAQFAVFMQQGGYQFSKIRDLDHGYGNLFKELVPSDYWKHHYDFGKIGGSGGSLGRSSCNNLVINSIVPLLWAYAIYTAEPRYCRLALSLLKQIPCEQNHILSYWKENGFKLSSALDSQALLELNNQYCSYKNCLNCEVGVSLLRSKAN